MCEYEALDKGVRLTMDLSATVHFMNGDPARIQQVLWNLIRNAIKFTPSGGLVTVRTLDAADGRIRLDIVDTGVGIRPESLPKVFDAFEQGDWQATREFGGLGLGLAIAKALVTLHGGRISAHSAGAGQGSTFTVELDTVTAPNAGDGKTPPARQQSRPADPSARPLSILLVEDHEDTAKALARLLRHNGHDVRTANSVSSAIRTVDAHPFDLLISDIGLPDGSGLDLMRQVRARAKLRGIVISGFGMESDIGRSKEAGFLEHLTKPVNLGELEAAIRRVTAAPEPDPAGV
jgi:CheY-like chemotaxis protein